MPAMMKKAWKPMMTVSPAATIWANSERAAWAMRSPGPDQQDEGEHDHGGAEQAHLGAEGGEDVVAVDLGDGWHVHRRRCGRSRAPCRAGRPSPCRRGRRLIWPGRPRDGAIRPPAACTWRKRWLGDHGPDGEEDDAEDEVVPPPRGEPQHRHEEDEDEQGEADVVARRRARAW